MKQINHLLKNKKSHTNGNTTPVLQAGIFNSMRRVMTGAHFLICAGVGVATLSLMTPIVVAQEGSAPPPATSPPISGKTEALTNAPYPQSVQLEGYEIIKYQPQLEEWIGQKSLKGRMAMSMQKSGSEDDPKYVSVEYLAATTLDGGKVKIGPRRITRWVFVDQLNESQQFEFKRILTKAMDLQTPQVVALDEMNANLERSKDLAKDADVNLSPPPIFYSEKPAVLLAFMGEPDFKAVDPKTNKVLFALNTNWDLLMDVASSTYYLLIGDGWVKTKNLNTGPWEIVKSVPSSFATLPDDENWKDVKKALKAQPFELVPQVFISKQPGELIETQGAPQMSPVSGTSLLYVKNTESDVFFYSGDAHYYYLVEGRWFKAKQLIGPWESATFDLPKEFAKIPKDHRKADILASVPGTDEAERAAVRATIPQTATVKRSETTLTVTYDGEPKFELIQGSENVMYAVNTENDVFFSNDRYYSCYQGVWFESGSPLGPWDVCDNVPEDIYSIPASAPQHNVTYVRVYNSTPSTVQVGYTSGYSGQYLIRGLLVFGAGYWLGHHSHHHYYHHWYRPSYIGWGCGSRWSWRYHGYYRPHYWGYGPYGGCVRPTLYHGGHYYRPYHRYGHYRPGYHHPAYSPWRPPVAHRPHPRPVPYSHWRGKGVRLDDRMARNHYNKRPVNRPGQYPTIGKPSKRPGSGILQRPQPVQRPAYRPTLRPSKKPVVRPGGSPMPGYKPGKKPGRRPSIRPEIKPMPGYKPGKKPSLRPSVKPVPTPGIKPGRKPSIRPETKPMPTPGKKPGRKPSIRPETKPMPTPGKKPGRKPSIRPETKPSPGYKPGKKPGNKPSLRPSLKPMPTKKPSYRPAPRPTVKPVPTRKPSYKPTPRPAVRPVPTKKPSYRPAPRPTVKPVPTRKSSYKPRATPVPRSNYRPAPKPSYKPTPKRSYRPAPKPSYRPTPRSNYKPAPRPSYKPAPRPSYKPTPRSSYKPTPRPSSRPAPRPSYRPTPRPAYTPPPSSRRSSVPSRAPSRGSTRRR